jgi:mannonate dehydratase
VWTADEINKRKALLEENNLKWEVVESIPVHEDIKKQNKGFHSKIENYKLSIRNLAKCGIKTICYNFMPVLDWTRTDLSYELPNGARALRFDLSQLAAFDIFILKRKQAKDSYTEKVLKNAETFYKTSTKIELDKLQRNIIAGLPGAEEGYTLQNFNDALDGYRYIDAEKLKENLHFFIKQIAPVAEEEEVKLAIHPDDPPFPIFGLPRVVSNRADIQQLLAAYQSKANGLCFCTGSLGVIEENDLVSIVNEFSSRVNFAHLRSTIRDEFGNFYEDNHLEGNVNMPAVMQALIKENYKRDEPIPFRPDHGHQMLDDLHKQSNPGYSAIGRLKGLAELRGLEQGISFMLNQNGHVKN